MSERVVPIGPGKFVAIGSGAGCWVSLRVKHSTSDRRVSFPMRDEILEWILDQNRARVAKWARNNLTLNELQGETR